jgi:hypothetical protein
MEKINYVARLKRDIQILEEEQSVKGQQLKEQLFLTYESFKPAKLIQSTLKDLVTSPYMLDNIIDTTLSVATGYFSRRLVVGASSNIIRKIIGSIIQAGATKFISSHSNTIKSFGQMAFQQIFRRKKKKMFTQSAPVGRQRNT